MHKNPSHQHLRIALAVLCTLLSCVHAVRGDWQLSWSDEFTGTSLNPSNWTFDIGNGSGGWGNNELEYYTSRPQNVYVTNGYLHIVCLKESYMGFNYTSAKLKTLGLFSQKYGRFEFYAKLPKGQGYWPAFWMMPRDSAYGGWAASGEIDVVENRGSNSVNVLGTIHYGSPYPGQAQSGGPSFNFTGGDSVTNFHLYALEWMTNSIRWYIDGQLYETQTNWWSSGGAYPAPFDQPFYIILNLAIGGNFGGNPDGTTVYPGEIQLDYVRAYNWVSVPTPPPVLKLKFPFDDPPGSTSVKSDTNAGANLTLQMLNAAGTAADLHGAAGSDVMGSASGGRSIDFSSNSTNQPVNPGPVAMITNANLGLGMLTNFVVSFWFKQNAVMAQGANLGPRLFVLGGGTAGDTGATNSIGMKFQTASQLYFQIGGTTISASFSNNLPSKSWIFAALTFDGVNAVLYTGNASNSVTQVGAASLTASVDSTSGGYLILGNRYDRQRSFNGSIDDFRIYSGIGDSNFVENVRLLEANPSASSLSKLTVQYGSVISLIWSGGILQSTADLDGTWVDLPNATSPYPMATNAPRQFYRVRF